MSSENNLLLRFVKNWTLPIAIVTGALAYLVYSHLSVLNFTRPYAAPTVAVVQPILIFSMLFLSFCKIDVKELRPRITHLWLLLIQCGCFSLLCLIIHFLPTMSSRVVVEAAALCLICPTATSAAVVTQKLHGDGADITMYTLLINLAVSVVVPLLIPFVGGHSGLSFLTAFWSIMQRVFPMLICPLIAAQLVRWGLPRLHAWLVSFHNLAFYLWAIALSIAIAVTTRSIMHTNNSMFLILGICLASLFCCVIQFALGRIIGRHYKRPISTCQSLGQKNTVFAIWMGYTFLDPVTSLAGGFYSIWHNLYNTYQLRREARKK